MVVGQKVDKFTFLADNVEICGTVAHWGYYAPDANLEIDIIVDDNYKHLVALTPGSGSQYPSGGGTVIHCETESISDQQHPTTYSPPKSSDQPGTKTDGTQLTNGDHVRLVGQLRIENMHTVNNFMHGWLWVGYVFVELHPYDYKNIQPIVPLSPSDTASERMTVVAPMYGEAYCQEGCGLAGLGSWANSVAGVSGGGDGSQWTCIFIDDDCSGFYNSVTGNAYVKAPPLDGTGFTPSANLIAWREDVVSPIQTSVYFDEPDDPTISAMRTINVVNDGIRVSATVTAPTVLQFCNCAVADVNRPVVFQADHSVLWLPRLIFDNNAPVDYMVTDSYPYDPQIDLGTIPVGADRGFVVPVYNQGPDPIYIQDIGFVAAWPGGNNAPPAAPLNQNFVEWNLISDQLPIQVDPWSCYGIQCIASGEVKGSATAVLNICTNDPSISKTLFVEINVTVGPIQPLPLGLQAMKNRVLQIEQGIAALETYLQNKN